MAANKEFNMPHNGQLLAKVMAEKKVYACSVSKGIKHSANDY